MYNWINDNDINIRWINKNIRLNNNIPKNIYLNYWVYNEFLEYFIKKFRNNSKINWVSNFTNGIISSDWKLFAFKYTNTNSLNYYKYNDFKLNEENKIYIPLNIDIIMSTSYEKT